MTSVSATQAPVVKSHAPLAHSAWMAHARHAWDVASHTGVVPLHDVPLHTHLPVCPEQSGVAPLHATQDGPQAAATAHGSHAAPFL